MAEGQVFLERAGYWRRTLAASVDFLIVAVPASLIVPAMFAATGGLIQGSTGINFSVCTPVSTVPRTLDPAPPENSNFAAVCDGYTLAGRSWRVLSVGRMDKTSQGSTTVSEAYRLNAKGEVVQGFNVSGFEWLVLLAMVIVLQHRTGRTVGQTLTKIHLSAAFEPVPQPIPYKPLLVRYAVLLGVYFVPFAVFAAAVKVGGVGVQAGGAGWVPLLLIMGLVWTVWSLWNMIRIVRRHPAVYDQAAGLEVLRTRP